MERDIKIKICGITTEEEMTWLVKEQVEYAGFVIWEKSKRYVSIENAKDIFEKLNPAIKKVAVTVNPDEELVKEIEEAGFDILQVHGKLSDEVIKRVHIPIWQAVNLSGMEQLEEITGMFQSMDPRETDKIAAVLFDAKEYGSGKTFGWEDFSSKEEASEKQKEIQKKFATFREVIKEKKIDFILAGGLTIDNVRKGITIFSPDIVDVSSGVECDKGDTLHIVGKDYDKIKQFVQNTRRLEHRNNI